MVMPETSVAVPAGVSIRFTIARMRGGNVHVPVPHQLAVSSSDESVVAITRFDFPSNPLVAMFRIDARDPGRAVVTIGPPEGQLVINVEVEETNGTPEFSYQLIGGAFEWLG